MTIPGTRQHLALAIVLFAAILVGPCAQAAGNTYDFPTRSPVADLVCVGPATIRNGMIQQQRDHVLAKGKVNLPPNCDIEIILRYDGVEEMQYLEQLSRANVTVFKAASLDLEDSQLVHIKGLQSLRNLNLDTTLVSDKSLALIAGLKNLAELRLSGTNIKGTGFDNLDKLTHLKMLNISSLSLAPGSLSKLKPLMPRMINLTLARCNLSTEDVASVGQLNTIEHLDIAFNRKIDDRYAATLSHMSKLTELTINDTDITAKSMPVLIKLPNLRQIVIRGREFWRGTLPKKEMGRIKFVDVATRIQVPTDVFEPLH